MLGTPNRLRGRRGRSESREREKAERSGGSIRVNGTGHGKKKTLMDHWVEPTLAEKPSYRDHRGSPYGVLEHMQPLGELPNTKVKTRVKPDAARKSQGARVMAQIDADARETPERSPTPPSAAAPAPETMATRPSNDRVGLGNSSVILALL